VLPNSAWPMASAACRCIVGVTWLYKLRNSIGVGVAEAFGGDLRGDALREHQRGAGVAQAVGGQAGETGRDRQLGECLRHGLRVVRVTVGLGEDVVGRLVAGAPSLEALPPEHTCEAVVEVDGCAVT
jgi:hypothetical protein